MCAEPCRAKSNWLAIIVAATSVTVANLLVLLWVTHEGWLGGTAFPKPLGARLVAYGALNLVFVMGPLAIYARLRCQSARLALVTYLASVATFSLVSIPVLHAFLARGIFVFGGPYSVAADVTWGAAQYLAALGLYQWTAAHPS